jgi:hypothetical protein
MNKIFGAILLCLCAAAAHAASGDQERWVTFKSRHDINYGMVQHQIDRASIHQEGPYRIFASREWIAAKREPMLFTINEKLFFVSRKYAVDCVHKRFGDRFIDSQNVREKVTSLANMHWTPLAKVPAVERTVCR